MWQYNTSLEVEVEVGGEEGEMQGEHAGIARAKICTTKGKVQNTEEKKRNRKKGSFFVSLRALIFVGSESMMTMLSCPIVPCIEVCVSMPTFPRPSRLPLSEVPLTLPRQPAKDAGGPGGVVAWVRSLGQPWLGQASDQEWRKYGVYGERGEGGRKGRSGKRC